MSETNAGRWNATRRHGEVGELPVLVPETTEPVVAQSGFRLARVAGIEVRVDWSQFVVYWMISFSLGAGWFPSLHPEWPPALNWSLAVLAALLFFGSILAHELAHALVGRAQGVPIEGITLFIFGGVARMKGEPPSARAEFLMAIVGPLTSLAIGCLATLAGVLMTGAGDATAAAPEALLRRAGPVATLLLWLGPINIMLGVFNLLPGFPLDGGRVLRSVLWHTSRDMERATKWSTDVTKVIAALLVATGIMMAFGFRVPFFGVGLFQGLWLILIGWFMNAAARMSYQQVLVRMVLGNTTVARLMRADVPAVPPDLTVDALVDDYLMATDQDSFPVVADGKLQGIVSLPDVRRLRRTAWPTTTVAEIMTTADRLATVSPEENAAEALRKLTARDVEQAPVVAGGRLAGMLRRGDVLRWYELQGHAAH